MKPLEYEAVALAHRSLELGTGYRQPEAVALYRSTGWTAITPAVKAVPSRLASCASPNS